MTMTKNELMPKYEAGERTCPVCAALLPAHQTWPGARYRFCGKPECTKMAMTAFGSTNNLQPAQLRNKRQEN